jgi:hypothetical protein
MKKITNLLIIISKGDLHYGICLLSGRLTEEMIEQLKANLSKDKTFEDSMDNNGAIKNLIVKSLQAIL